ncbi:MAG: YigZ family protein [Bacteroidia bacterium]|nr:YigZ family protein [Bacteroidia bacterium]
MTDSFRSISTPTEAYLREKGSKFLAFAWPVSSLAEIESHLEETRKKFHDSRHVCFAYRLGPAGEEWRAYDAGEPAHSAGDPILNEIRSLELTQILVVVVRYFGGTKLGIPGLIEAYKTVTREALSQATIVESVITEPLSIRFPYEMTSTVNKILHHHKLEPGKAEYGADCRMEIPVRKGLSEELQNVFLEIGILEKKIDPK